MNRNLYGSSLHQPQTYDQAKVFGNQEPLTYNSQGVLGAQQQYDPQQQCVQQFLPQQYPASPAGLSSALSSLTQMEHVTVKQLVEMLEVLSGWETANQYEIISPQGQLIMRCGEKSGTLSRMCLGANRPMHIDIVDLTSSPVIRIDRPYKLWKKHVIVQDAQGQPLGVVRKKFSVKNKKFIIENASGEVLLVVKGRKVYARKFRLLTPNGEQEVGQIYKRWSGLAQEMFTDADTFTCFFPASADATLRALLIATTLFIDLTYFETSSNANRR